MTFAFDALQHCVKAGVNVELQRGGELLSAAGLED